MPKLMIETKLGKAYNSSIEDFMSSAEGKKLKGKVNLIFTSPPYPLVSPKKYGNKQGEEYLQWVLDGVLKDLAEDEPKKPVLALPAP